MSFDIPRGWHLTNAWKDEIPSVYILTDSGREGRPVSLSISRQRRNSPAFEDMNVMIRREKEWHGAEVTGRGKVGGLAALFMELPSESKTAFVETGDGYYVISYNAPKEAYKQHLNAYEKVLKTFKHYRGKRKKKKK